MKPNCGVRRFAIAVSLMVAAAAAAGLYVSGSPGSERARRLDEQRVNDLRSLSYAIDDYAIRQGSLPESIDDVEAQIPMKDATDDPETGGLYAYRTAGGLDYELCADFALPSSDDGDPYATRETMPVSVPEKMYAAPAVRDWTHPAGHHCYRLTAPQRVGEE